MQPEPINILIVDDHKDNLFALEELLHSPDYRLVKAHSGREALERLLQEEFALILLDVQMPELDGFETAKLIKQREKSKYIPIIFLTAINQEETYAFKGYSVGAVDYLVKPFHPDILKSKVAVFVELFKKSRLLLQEQKGRLEAEATHRSLSFLTDAGTLLGSSLDYRLTIEKVAHLTVPRLADWCIVDILEGGSLRRIAMAHTDPEKEELARRLERRYPTDLNAPFGVPKVIRTGRSELYPEISDTLLNNVARDAEHLQILRDAGLKSAMIIPLLVRGRVLGAVTFLSAESRRVYSEGDRTLAEELTRRAAFAIDNARLYEAAQTAIQHKEESLALLDTLLATAPVGLAFVDRELRFVRINQSLAAMNGLSAEKIIGRTVRELVPKTADRVELIYRQVLDTGKPVLDIEVSGEAPGAPGEKRHWLVDYYPVRKENQEILGVGVVVADVTEQKRSEEALRVSEGRLRTVIEQSPLSIQIFSPEGRTIQVNQAWEKMWGLSREILGAYNILEDPQLVRKGLMPYIRRAFAGEPVQIPAILYDPAELGFQGRPRWVGAFLYPVKDEQGRPREFVLIHEDITDRREAEEALRISRERLDLAIRSTGLGLWYCDLPFDKLIWNERCKSISASLPTRR